MSAAGHGQPADPAADVTILIPAYQAEAFIDRTLACARNQTYRGVRILVSIDRSTDATAAICERHGAEDERVRVFAQPERLGWVGNVNFLLDRVETPFFFLYFHDDIIEPAYVERLRNRLLGAPEAICAYCTVAFFNSDEAPRRATDFAGPAAERLAGLLAVQNRGMPFRGLTRSRLLEQGVRLTARTQEGFDAQLPYLMEMVAAGPVLGVDEPLYRHWLKRPGGLVDGWQRAPAGERLAGFRDLAAEAMRIVERAVPAGAERHLAAFCLYLFVMIRVRRMERRLKAEPVDAADIHPAFADLAFPAAADTIDPALGRAIERNYAVLLLLEARVALAAGDAGRALERLAAAVALDPDFWLAWKVMARALSRLGSRPAAEVVQRRADRLRRQGQDDDGEDTL